MYTLLAARRLLRDVEHEHRRVSLTQLIADATKAWHGAKLNQPDWGEHSHSIAFTAEMPKEQMLVHLILNAYWESLEFEVPPAAGPWRRWIDTSLPSPQDIASRRHFVPSLRLPVLTSIPRADPLFHISQ